MKLFINLVVAFVALSCNVLVDLPGVSASKNRFQINNAFARRANDHPLMNKKRVASTASTAAAALRNHDDSSVVAIKSTTTRGGSSITEQMKSNAKISYFFEVGWCIINIVFAWLWIQSMGDGKQYFNKSVLDDGFCNKVNPSLMGTQTMCCLIDFLMVGAASVMLKGKVPTESQVEYTFARVYTLVHGLVHLMVGINPGLSSGDIDTASAIGLAIIMIIGPIAIHGTLEETGVEGPYKLIAPLAAWFGYVYVFVKFLGQKQYALTYINVVIFLSRYLPRVIRIGYKKEEDIANRSSRFISKRYLGIAATVTMVIMLAEPLVCDKFFNKIGGHVWFDVSLFLMLLSDIPFNNNASR